MTLKEQLKNKIDNKTKPLGSLGILEDLAIQIGQIQNTLSPELKNPSLIVFAADHGITDEQISPYPKDVTWQMVMNFCNGGAAINAFCKQNEIALKVVDVGVDYEFPKELSVTCAKIRKGSRNILKEPAMTADECNNAILAGRNMVQNEFMLGCNTVAFGEMGIGNTSSSALLMHKFTGFSIEECAGKGAGLNNDGLNRKIEILKKAAQQHNTNSPVETLAAYGGLEIAAMVGGFLEAAKLKMVILVDGFIATAAAITAVNIDPNVLENCIFCHVSDEKGHRKMLEFLGVRPVLDLSMRLGEGSGVAVAFPIVKSAVVFLNEMASFEDAHVSNKTI